MMPKIIRRLAYALIMSAALVFSQAGAQDRGGAGQPVISPTIAAKTPVFAGACKACPWGILAIVTSDALKFYGYDTKVCWMCATSLGPREIGDKTKPVVLDMSGAVSEIPAYFMETSPDAVPDFGATSEQNLINAWNGAGDYAKDHKQRHNYRVIAVVRTSTYILAAASKKSGITNLQPD
jgi:hypothetical protein